MALPKMIDEEGFDVLFRSLCGGWRLEKTFSDGSRFEGVALFETSGEDSLKLHERGNLTLAPGTCLRAERRWKWQLMGAATLIVRYAAERDGEIYHATEMNKVPDGWTGSAEHLCGADVYCADYLLKPDEIIIRHDISGPRKALSISARHHRLPG